MLKLGMTQLCGRRRREKGGHKSKIFRRVRRLGLLLSCFSCWFYLLWLVLVLFVLLDGITSIITIISRGIFKI